MNEYTKWIYDSITGQYVRLIVSQYDGVIGVEFSLDRKSVLDFATIMKRTKGFAKWQRVYRIIERMQQVKEIA